MLVASKDNPFPIFLVLLIRSMKIEKVIVLGFGLTGFGAIHYR